MAFTQMYIWVVSTAEDQVCLSDTTLSGPSAINISIDNNINSSCFSYEANNVPSSLVVTNNISTQICLSHSPYAYKRGSRSSLSTCNPGYVLTPQYNRNTSVKDECPSPMIHI